VPLPYTEADALRLAELDGAASFSTERLGVTMTIDASGPAQAITKALRKIAKADVRGEPVAVEVLTTAEQDRQLAEPAFPELAGVSEIAELLGVSRQRASSVQHLEAFPAPVAELRSGPVWRKADLTRFAETWERKPGRPRKVEDLMAALEESVEEAKAARRRAPVAKVAAKKAPKRTVA
jgi:predicted DNA-binding protein (UPF0251 family)